MSPTNPYSKFAREQAIENALAQSHISFEEYVEALDDDANAPKGKFKDILEKRKALQEQQAQSELEQAKQIIAKQQQLLGGNTDPNMNNMDWSSLGGAPNGQV